MDSHGLHQGKAHMHGGIDKQISRVLQRDLTGSMMIYGSQQTMGGRLRQLVRVKRCFFS